MVSHQKMIGFASAAVIAASAAAYYAFSRDIPSFEQIDHPAVEQTDSYARRLRRALDEQDQETRFAAVREVVDDVVCQLPEEMTVDLDGSVHHGAGSPGTLVLRYSEPDLSRHLGYLCAAITPGCDQKLQEDFVASAGRALDLQILLGIDPEIKVTYSTTFTCDRGGETQ